MSNEIKISASLTVTNGNYQTSFKPSQLQVDQAAVGANSGVATVGFAASEALPVGDVSTLGWLVLRNLDDTNFVLYGPDDTGMVTLGRLNPGEFAMLRLAPGVTMHLQADTGACAVYYLLLED